MKHILVATASTGDYPTVDCYPEDNIQAWNPDRTAIKVGGDWYPVLECTDRTNQLLSGKIKQVLTQPGNEVDKPAKAHGANLKTIIRAAEAGALGLMECEFKATGEKVAVLCAFTPDDKGMINMTPFAVLLNGNPYEMLNPPNPDGGFKS